MAKGDKFYFDNFAASTELSKEAATYPVSCMENYDPESIEQMLVKCTTLKTAQMTRSTK